MDHRMLVRGWRVAVVGLVAVTLLISWPMSPGASAGVRTPSATAVGNTYGGLTSQGMPVFVEMTATRRQVVRMVAAIGLDCTSGSSITVPDKYVRIPVTKAGRLRIAYGPVTFRNDDGTTTDFSARITGALNDGRTVLSGSWRVTLVDHDAAGTVTDTCDSGPRGWKAKQ